MHASRVLTERLSSNIALHATTFFLSGDRAVREMSFHDMFKASDIILYIYEYSVNKFFWVKWQK